jgi:hypothetical protein
VGFWGTEKLGANAFVRAYRVLLYSFYTLVFTVLAWPPAVIWALFSVAKSDWLYHTPHVSNVTEEPEAERDLALRQSLSMEPFAERALIESPSAAAVAEGVIL